MGGPTACTQVSTKIAIFAYLNLTRSLFLCLSISSLPSSSLSSWSPSSPPSLRSRWQLRWQRRRAAAPSHPLGGKAARSGARGEAADGGHAVGWCGPAAVAPLGEAMRRRGGSPMWQLCFARRRRSSSSAAACSAGRRRRPAVVRWPRNGAVERGAARPTAGGGWTAMQWLHAPPFFLFFF